jgi:ribokinase
MRGDGPPFPSHPTLMRAAVVGHVEWVDFARVERVPAPGEIAHALAAWEEAAGGGAVAAVQLARLGADTTFFAALGDDVRGRAAVAELESRGVQVRAAWRPPPQRRAFTFLDAAAERTITVMGERHVPHGDDPLPWDELDATDAVYFTGGDGEALAAARRARVLVATPRARGPLAGAGVQLDALVHSGSDAGESYDPGDVEPPPRLVVATLGARGGRWTAAEGRTGTFQAAPLPGPPVDAYGCGDSFAAGLTFGLGRGGPIEDALDLASRCGAACLTGNGPYTAQLRLGRDGT